MRQIHIRVDDELYNELTSYSTKNELSMQDCVREAYRKREKIYIY